MKKNNYKQTLTVIVALIVVLSGLNAALLFLHLNEKAEIVQPIGMDDILSELGIKTMTLEYTFSEPYIKESGDYCSVHVNESDLDAITFGKPVLPVNLTVIELPFGTEIIDFSYEYSTPKIIDINKKVSFGSYSLQAVADDSVYISREMYPSEYVSYQTGGGLSGESHKTFLVVRVYPAGYMPLKNQLSFVKNVKVNIKYKEPAENILGNNHVYDLLIIAPSSFTKPLQPLVNHKNNMGVKTKLVTLNEVYDKAWYGRDEPEKIKYFIKDAIENWGIKYVILVGCIKGQSKTWNLPVRYSHVMVTKGAQETLEPSFISDLYYADIYDSNGNFSSWDSNNNGIFGEWTLNSKDEMDLYPDVYLGRLPCRNTFEVKSMVDKIINYEKSKANENWFKKIILISGDHWKDPEHVNEGALIMDNATKMMPGFKPVNLVATEKNKLLVKDINNAINQGAGFVYFCGHGGSTAWGTHNPPDATGWAPTLTKSGKNPFYTTLYMNFLKNKNKYPITVVGGCYNAKFDMSIALNKKLMFSEHCWAEKLVIKRNGGAIATIANTALGTHALGDSDGNSVNDYVEILDGWLELRFFQLYGIEHNGILGENHGEAITDYLHRFIGNNDPMDTKMVQQWVLFGDPSLEIGGYE